MNYESTLYTVCTCIVVMGVSDCENFKFEYRVVITLLGCAGFMMLVWI